MQFPVPKPLFTAVSEFDGGTISPMLLSIEVPDPAQRSLRGRAVFAMEFAVAIPSSSVLRRPFSRRTILAMKFAFFVAPFDRAVPSDLSDGIDLAFGLHSLAANDIVTTGR